MGEYSVEDVIQDSVSVKKNTLESIHNSSKKLLDDEFEAAMKYDSNQL